MAVSSGRVYVADFGNDRIQVFRSRRLAASPRSVHAASGEGQFLRPAGVAVGPDGTLYVTDHFNDRVERFSGDGHYLAQVGTAQAAVSLTQAQVVPTETPTPLPSVVVSPTATLAPTLGTVTATSSPAASMTPVASLHGSHGDHPHGRSVAEHCGHRSGRACRDAHPDAGRGPGCAAAETRRHSGRP